MEHVRSDLLASLMSAMAIRILFLRKMRSRMMMTSTIARMITAKQRKQQIIMDSSTIHTELYYRVSAYLSILKASQVCLICR